VIVFASLSAFLCPLTANVYNIEFLSFTISDYETKRLIFEVGGDTGGGPRAPVDMSQFAHLDENSYRKIKYEFSEDVLKLPTISTR
jgi:hypothetical protein